MSSSSNVPMAPQTRQFTSGTSDAEIAAAVERARQQRKQLVIFLRLLILVVLLGGWELAADTGLVDPFFYSSPSLIGLRLYEWMTEGTVLGPLWMQIGVTMEEAILGFVFGSLAGIIIGVLLGSNKLAADVFSIYIKVANSIPRIVLAPLFIIILGLGLASKVALAFVMVFFVVFANAFQGVREADRNLQANAQILGASSWQLARSVVIPAAMSWIFASLHVSFGLAIVGAIVGEFVGSRYGIGQLISIARGAFDPAGVFAGMIVVLVVALIADFLMTSLEHHLLKWRPRPFNEMHD